MLVYEMSYATDFQVASSLCRALPSCPIAYIVGKLVDLRGGFGNCIDVIKQLQCQSCYPDALRCTTCCCG